MNFSSHISGFVDGEGCFLISFNFRAKMKSKIEIRPSFSISQNKRNLEILQKIHAFFKCGAIRFSKKDQNYKFEVRAIEDLMRKIIPHFQNFPLQTSKQKDFEIFSEICEKIFKSQHLNFEHLKEIIKKAYQMNPSGKRKYSQEKLLSFLTR